PEWAAPVVWHNPPISWAELERRLSGRSAQRSTDQPIPDTAEPPIDSPAEHTELPYGQLPYGQLPYAELPYAELHCHSSYSFLDGCSDPDELITEAARLKLHGLALTDHDGFAGAPLFAEAAAQHQVRTVYGAELSLGMHEPQNGIADPHGTHLLVLARGAEGYHRLAAAITDANLRGEQKGVPRYDIDELADYGRDHWVILTGCRKGAVRQALDSGGRAAAGHRIDELTDMFGTENVLVELTDHGSPLDSDINDALADLAASRTLAT